MLNGGCFPPRYGPHVPKSSIPTSSSSKLQQAVYPFSNEGERSQSHCRHSPRAKERSGNDMVIPQPHASLIIIINCIAIISRCIACVRHNAPQLTGLSGALLVCL